jgi:hypothetical protein
MTNKWRSLDKNMKLEIIGLCEVGRMSRCKIEAVWINFSALFMILKKRKYGIY